MRARGAPGAAGRDVNYQVAKEFCDEVKKKSLGAEVLASIRPGEQFVKIVHDELLACFSSETPELTPNRPLRILLCGLNGSGKTTTCGKLAAWFKKTKAARRPDRGRPGPPAAIEQLQILGKQIGVTVLTFPARKARRPSPGSPARKSPGSGPKSPSSTPPAASTSTTRCSPNSKRSARRGSRRNRSSSPMPPPARPR